METGNWKVFHSGKDVGKLKSKTFSNILLFITSAFRKISGTFANFFRKGVFSCNKMQKTAVKWSVSTKKH